MIQHGPRDRNRQLGFTLIEALVALVILLIGLLGLAGLQVRIKQYQMESYQRAQAVVLLEDMVNRINANRQVATCYAFTTSPANGTPYLGNSSSFMPACTLGTTNQQNRANTDLTEWGNLLQGAAEGSSGATTNNLGAMVGARGCVTYDATNDVYMVTVVWQGMSSTNPPQSGLTCATGLYGNESQRRAVSATVKIGKLS